MTVADLVLRDGIERLPRLFLIIIGHFQSQMTAARVDYQVDAAVLSLIGLDEVIAASERSQAAVSLADIHPVGAVKLAEVNLLREEMSLSPDAESRGALWRRMPSRSPECSCRHP